jgi:uncharacterized protein (TIGR03437 family)
MLRTEALLIFCLSSLGFAQSAPITPITVTSAASASTDLAAGSLATVTGVNLAGQTAKAESAPWPTSLGGVTVQVVDSGMMTRLAGLLFVSPGQINFQVPAGTAVGAATVTVNTGSGTYATTVQIRPVAPGLFSINSLGVAAATAVRIALPNGMQFPVQVFQCADTPESCRLTPVDPGVDAPVYLSFYGTGIAGRSSLGAVQVTVGKTTIPATYAGPQGQFPGLDQVNIPLVLSLRGAGEVAVTVTVDGVTSNAVKIAVQ